MTPQKPIVIDLFAGVGGLSLGAARAGFEVKAAVDSDQRAIESHARNFPKTIHLNVDIGCLRGHSLLETCGIKPGGLHGLIGGPPCQGFSAIGHRALSDPRNTLFDHFFRLVSEIRPCFFVAENVPGLLTGQNRDLLTNALSRIRESYTVLPPLMIRASNYGVPTTRTRVFFIGYDPDGVANLDAASFLSSMDTTVLVRHALRELPAVRPQWSTQAQGWRSVGELEPTEFGRRIMDFVPSGVGDPEALRLYKKRRLVSGFLGTVHSVETILRFSSIKPGEVDSVSKFPRLDRNGYCPTLRAGTGPERGSFQAVRPIHPGSPRVITPREAARLQGFPDWFQFDRTKWHSFRQIGNSVSPIVAELVLSKLRCALPG